MKIVFILGTRPEAIKLAPLIREFKKYPEKFQCTVLSTGQHKEMLSQILNFFDIEKDIELSLMQPNQTLPDFISKAIYNINNSLIDINPDLVFVQGDTATVFAASFVSFLNKYKVAHLEAGLRTHNKFSPFPEEINRVLTSNLADFHFAPTYLAVENLKMEQITKNVWQVGNTVIDALLKGIEKVNQNTDKYISNFKTIDTGKKIILVTGHRRENFGKPFQDICFAIRELALSRPEIQFVYPVHLNPNVQKPVHEILDNLQNVILLDPLAYDEFIWLMDRSYLILTDSGGVQEEAPSLGKPILVTRENTERPEGIEVGTAKLVGTKKENIIQLVLELLNNPTEYEKIANATNPYGNGDTSKKIREIIEREFNLE